VAEKSGNPGRPRRREARRFEADRERDELAITLQHATLRITWR
jgi:hypothetical protein